MTEKLTTEEFIQRSNKIHENKYDYSESVYTLSKENIKIICPTHGEFFQIAGNHLKGGGCHKCSMESRSSNKTEFVKKAQKLFGNKFDYSKVKYLTDGDKIIIVCPIHGEFSQIPYQHLTSKHGCIECSYVSNADNWALSTEEFIQRSNEIHENKYDYSESVYTLSKENIKIICPTHGEFFQIAGKHLKGRGCHKCFVERVTSSKTEFVKKAQKLFGNKFDYSKVKYTRSDDKVIIVCPIHGEFSQAPNKHLTSKHGCLRCSYVSNADKQSLSAEEFISKAREVHGNLYDYSKADYVTARKKVVITCKDHGDFEQLPYSHLRGSKCSYCAGTKIGPKNNLAYVFPKIAKEWHPTKNKTKPNEHYSGETSHKYWWICNKGHEWETPISYRTGKRNTGCPYCAGQKVGKDNNLEAKFPSIAEEWHPTKNGTVKASGVMPGTDKKYWWLCKKGHEYKAQPGQRTGKDKTGCPHCTNQTSTQEMRIMAELDFLDIKILSRYKIKKVEFDVYLPEFNIAIEYDGSYWHRDKETKDKAKSLFAQNNHIKLIRLREAPLEKIEESDICTKDNVRLFKSDLNELMKEIEAYAEELKPKISRYIILKEFANEELFNKYLSYAPSPLPEKSLELLFPKVSIEWNYERNFPLTPKNFTKGSGYKAWWKCSKGHEWKTSINHRTSEKPTGCVKCYRENLKSKKS